MLATSFKVMLATVKLSFTTPNTTFDPYLTLVIFNAFQQWKERERKRNIAPLSKWPFAQRLLWALYRKKAYFLNEPSGKRHDFPDHPSQREIQLFNQRHRYSLTCLSPFLVLSSYVFLAPPKLFWAPFPTQNWKHVERIINRRFC